MSAAQESESLPGQPSLTYSGLIGRTCPAAGLVEEDLLLDTRRFDSEEGALGAELRAAIDTVTVLPDRGARPPFARRLPCGICPLSGPGAHRLPRGLAEYFNAEHWPS